MSSLEGTLLEHYTGRPVQGAVVAADGYRAVSDARGYFRFLSLPPKVYTVQIIHRDFETASTVLDLSVPARLYTMGTVRLRSIIRALR